MTPAFVLGMMWAPIACLVMSAVGAVRRRWLDLSHPVSRVLRLMTPRVWLLGLAVASVWLLVVVVAMHTDDDWALWTWWGLIDRWFATLSATPQAVPSQTVELLTMLSLATVGLPPLTAWLPDTVFIGFLQAAPQVDRAGWKWTARASLILAVLAVVVGVPVVPALAAAPIAPTVLLMTWRAARHEPDVPSLGLRVPQRIAVAAVPDLWVTMTDRERLAVLHATAVTGAASWWMALLTVAFAFASLG